MGLLKLLCGEYTFEKGIIYLKFQPMTSIPRNAVFVLILSGFCPATRSRLLAKIEIIPLTELIQISLAMNISRLHTTDSLILKPVKMTRILSSCPNPIQTYPRLTLLISHTLAPLRLRGMWSMSEGSEGGGWVDWPVLGVLRGVDIFLLTILLHYQ